jgi:hypothetical protein
LGLSYTESTLDSGIFAVVMYARSRFFVRGRHGSCIGSPTCISHVLLAEGQSRHGVLSHGRAIHVLGMSLSGMGGWMGDWILGSQLAQSTPVPSTWSKELADERRRLVGEGRRFRGRSVTAAIRPGLRSNCCRQQLIGERLSM